MTEKDLYLAAFEREYQTTLKVLRAYPANKTDLKPAEKLRNARELAWMLVLNQSVVVPTSKGDLQLGTFPEAPAWKDILPDFERAHREALAALDGLTEEQMNGSLKLPVAPRRVGDVRIADALWMFLNDTIHHRGQFAVYLRIAGGKVPSIYGPTADEPWN